MAIIPDSTISSLREYLELKQEQQAEDRKEPALTKKHRYLVPERPRVCPNCSATESFWVKGYYFRWAVEAELEEAIPVPRYSCNCCCLVVSLLFVFLVPFRQFTGKTITGTIQNYLLEPATYRQVAGEAAGSDDRTQSPSHSAAEEEATGDDDEMQRPNHSQVWRWVNLLVGRAAKDLNVRVQRACMAADKESCLDSVHKSMCPNAEKAQSNRKSSSLHCGAKLLSLAEILLEKPNMVEALWTYFVSFVQPVSSILTGRGVMLLTPQSSHHVIR